MELLLTDEQRLLQDSATKFLDRIGGRKHAREWRRKDGGFDAKCLREIGELGWLAMLVPAELDGMGCGPYELALLLEQAGRALAPEPIAAATLAAAAIADGDNETARRTLLKPATAGQALIIPALQEATWDSDAMTPATTVDAEATRINGHKDFVAAATASAGFLVNARNAKGEEFGALRFNEILARTDRSPAKLGEAVLANAKAFADGLGLRDDVVIVCFGRDP